MNPCFPGAKTVAVISDSHRDRNTLELAEKALASVDGILHLGDVVSDAAYLRSRLSVPLLCVRGNCDFPGAAPEELYGLLGGREGAAFFACHGHRFDVKTNPFTLLYRCRELGAKVALYGHTHIAYCREEGGVLLVNPGAMRDGRYALLHIEEGDVRAELLRL